MQRKSPWNRGGYEGLSAVVPQCGEAIGGIISRLA